MNRSTPNVDQHSMNTTPNDPTRQQQNIPATPLRPRIRAVVRPISPEKLARRPRSAFDLRGGNGVGRFAGAALNTTSSPGPELRKPALRLTPSSKSLAMSKEPDPQTVERVIDTILDTERGGSATPGQRMADRFLKERKSTPALEGSAERLRGGLLLVREDTPAFL